jgi:nitrous oxide reductase accessory protein NosL
MIRTWRWIALAVLLIASTAVAAEKSPPAPSAKEKCPVCGMFVGRHSNWTGALRFKDSSYVYFDGPKDLFAYFLDIKKYDSARNASDVVAVHVTDYYALAWIDGRKAFYVIGGDVYGPMGKELIPFEKAADANGFLKDHKGNKVLRFEEITPQVLKSLE